MPRAGIALGSNLGNRIANLAEATRRLEEMATKNQPFLKAPIYQTEPLQCPPDSPEFLNTVVEFEFNGSAAKLLKLTRSIENSMGRIASPLRNAPRLIDVDILYLGNEQIDSPDLVLPHPRMHQRRFVLQPLADIRPDLLLPGHAIPITELLATLACEETPLVAIN